MGAVWVGKGKCYWRCCTERSTYLIFIMHSCSWRGKGSLCAVVIIYHWPSLSSPVVTCSSDSLCCSCSKKKTMVSLCVRQQAVLLYDVSLCGCVNHSFVSKLSRLSSTFAPVSDGTSHLCLFLYTSCLLNLCTSCLCLFTRSGEYYEIQDVLWGWGVLWDWVYRQVSEVYCLVLVYHEVCGVYTVSQKSPPLYFSNNSVKN